MEEQKNNITTFYILRHGQTQWNVEKRIQGQGDSPLTDEGLLQAASAAQRLKGVHFDKAFSSDLLRAKRTAEIIAAEHKLEVEATRLLRERSWGIFEGKSQEVFVKFNDYIKTLKDEEKHRYKADESVESDEDIAIRMLTFLRETALAYPGKTILVVSHGGIMRSLLIHLGFAGYDEFRTRFIGNTGHIKLACDGVDFVIKETYGIEGKMKGLQ